MYRAYQRSLVDEKLIDVSEKVDIAVQTDQLKIYDSSTMINTTSTTESYANIGSPAMRRAFYSISSDDDTPSHNNDTIEMPLIRVLSSGRHCFVCNTYYSKTHSRSYSLNDVIRAETLLTHSIIIREGSTCCGKYLDKTQFKTKAIALIKKNKSNTSTVGRDELLHSLDDLNMAYRRFQSMLDEANRRFVIDFNDLNRLTDEQCLILTGITKNNFLDLCSNIPSNSLRQSESRSANQAIGCLLVKLRLGLSHQVLATLFSLADKKLLAVFSRVLVKLLWLILFLNIWVLSTYLNKMLLLTTLVY